MHSHDRTLLASLGFSDPDKKTYLHDWSCQYIARPEVAAKIGRIAFGVDSRKIGSEFEHIVKTRSGYTVGFIDLLLHLEIPHQCILVDKNGWKNEEDRRKAHNAAVLALKDEMIALGLPLNAPAPKDVYMRIKYQYLFETCCNARPLDKWTSADRVKVYIEVKVNRVSAGDILRQIKLYSSNIPMDYSRFVVVVLFDIDEDDTRMLESEDIKVVTLGEEFRLWHDNRILSNKQ